MIAGLSWVDWAMVAVLLVSVVVGLWRGLVYELLALAGWLVAFLAAQAWGGWTAAWVPLGAPGSLSRLAAGFGLTFFVTLLAWSLLARLARTLISATPLTVLDRGLGAVFGLARGLLLLLVLALVVTWTPIARHWPAWQASQGAAWLDVLLHGLQPWWPAGWTAGRAGA